MPLLGEEVLFGLDQTGTQVFGTTNQTDTSVTFASIETLLAQSAGQARVEADDGSLNQIDFFLTGGGTFSKAIFNAFDGEGTATVTVVTNDGTFDYELDLGNGQNFLTITAINGETISVVGIVAEDGFADLRQVRITTSEGVTPVPEPATLLLVAGGCLGVLGLRRRKA